MTRMMVTDDERDGMAFAVARTRDEAQLYLELHPCPDCGSIDTLWEHSLIQVDGELTIRYAGICPGCEAEREYLFGLPARETRVSGWPTFGGPEPSEVRLSRDELLASADLEPEQLDQLEQFGLLARRGKGGTYDGDALAVASCVAEMARFGIEARHLRAYRTSADREIGLFEQVVTPLMRQRNPEARGRAEEAVRELAALSVRLHATLVRAGLRAELGG